MGMTVNMGSFNGSAVQRLRPWGIYEVTFKGIEGVTGTGKESGKDWKALKIKFAGESGIFEPMIFCPTDKKGEERPSGETGGKKWTLPSQLENFMYGVAHIGIKLGKPALWEKMSKVTYELPEDFDKIIKNLSQVVADAVGKPTHVKTVGDNRGYAAIPSYVGLSKDGDAFISNNWIGDGLVFDDYELKRKDKQKNAKPSSIDSETEKDVDSDSGDGDINFDI